MHCHIDPGNGIPIYEQICRQVRFAVANGSLIAGGHVPSVREMAGQLAVNANTVARAYRDLQTEGVLVSVRGTGLVISADAERVCRTSRLEMIRERLSGVLQEAVRNLVTREEMLSLFHSEWARLSGISSAPAGLSAPAVSSIPAVSTAPISEGDPCVADDAC